MKRSEMVNLMADFLQETLESQNYYDDVADELLNILEKQGMLPPLTYLENFNVFDNSWENEED